MTMSLADIQSFVEIQNATAIPLEFRKKRKLTLSKPKEKGEQNKVVVNSRHNKYRNEKNKAHFLEVRHNERTH